LGVELGVKAVKRPLVTAPSRIATANASTPKPMPIIVAMAVA
jgi:hypothetical protein